MYGGKHRDLRKVASILGEKWLLACGAEGVPGRIFCIYPVDTETHVIMEQMARFTGNLDFRKVLAIHRQLTEISKESQLALESLERESLIASAARPLNEHGRLCSIIRTELAASFPARPPEPRSTRTLVLFEIFKFVKVVSSQATAFWRGKRNSEKEAARQC
jgi:hypothetical protein